MVTFTSYVSLTDGKPPFSYGFPMFFPLKPPCSYVVSGVLSMCQPMSSTGRMIPSDQLWPDSTRRESFALHEALPSHGGLKNRVENGRWMVYGWLMDGEWGAFKTRFVGISRVNPMRSR